MEMWVIHKRRNKGFKRKRYPGNNNHARVYVKKEDFERECYDILGHPSADWRMFDAAGKRLGINGGTFEKYFNLWIAYGKKCDNLAVIAKEDDYGENDETRDREAAERIQGLPQIKRSYKRPL